MAIDAAMAASFVAVMATALVQEAPHEYLGIALFALVAAHAVVNRRWFARLARGRYNGVRVLQLIAVAGLLACVIGQVASSIVISEHALWWLPAVPGAEWARRIHMLCSYWGFVFAFAHAGLQFQAVAVRLGAKRPIGTATTWACRAVWIAISCFGAWSFVALGLPSYLAGQVQFAYADFATPLALTFAQYASIAVLVAGAFHCLDRLMRGRKQPTRSENGEGDKS